MTPDLNRDYRIQFLMYVLVAVLLFVCFMWVLVILVSRTAAAVEPCLTYKEARAKWPTVHLWYHTSEKCWDQHKDSGRTYGKRKRESTAPKEDLKPRPAPPARADSNGNDANVTYVKADEFNEIDAQADKPSVFYPALIPSNPVLMLTPMVMTAWPTITDIDDQQVFTPWARRIAGAFER